MNLVTEFKESFAKGQKEKAEAAEKIALALTNFKQSLEETNLVIIEPTDYDGLFIRLSQSSDKAAGWWTYLQVNTQPNGLRYTIYAGFGRKNEPASLRDTLPETISEKIDEALEIFQTYLVKGMYYLGTLKR